MSSELVSEDAAPVSHVETLISTNSDAVLAIAAADSPAPPIEAADAPDAAAEVQDLSGGAEIFCEPGVAPGENMQDDYDSSPARAEQLKEPTVLSWSPEPEYSSDQYEPTTDTIEPEYVDLVTLLSSLSTRPPNGTPINLLERMSFADVDELLEALGIQHPPHQTTLHYALLEREYTLIALLMKSNYRDLLNERDPLGRTPLHLALLLGDATAVQLFLSRPPAVHAATPVRNDVDVNKSGESADDIPSSAAPFNQLPLDITFPDIALSFAQLPTFHLPLATAYNAAKIPTVALLYHMLIGYSSLTNQVREGRVPLSVPEPFGELCGWTSASDEPPDDDDGQQPIPVRVLNLKDWRGALFDFLETVGVTELDAWGIDAVDSPNGLRVQSNLMSTGMSAFHRANAMGLPSIVELLLEGGADPLLKDAHGNLPVHHAINSGNSETFALMLRRGGLADLSSGCSPLKEETSIMALFRRCILRGAWKSLGRLVGDAVYSQYPISEADFDQLAEFAALCGFSREFAEAFNMAIDNTIPLENGSWRGRELSPVKIFTHEECLNHLPFPNGLNIISHKKTQLYNGYPENPTRLQVLIDPNTGVLRSLQFSRIPWQVQCPPASIADILRVHEWTYIRRLLNRVEKVTLGQFPLDEVDEDTPVTSRTWAAASSAAGTVLAAIRAVCCGETRTAFCAIRPPGHHVGTWGPCQLPTGEGGWESELGEEDWLHGSQGFCFLNNAAIAAAYARYRYAEIGIRRIAIVDFDVHHGNGTEQIVRNLTPRKRNLSVTTSRPGDFTLTANFTEDYWKPWLDDSDPDEVFFASIHGFGLNFYPGTGGVETLVDCKFLETRPSLPRSLTVQQMSQTSQAAAAAAETRTANVPSISRTPFDTIQSVAYNQAKRAHPNFHNIPLFNKSANRQTFRDKFLEKVVSPLSAFNPDLLIVSAGFDGHCLDVVNAGYGGCCEDDFEWMTRLLVAIANDHCDGRIVIRLEPPLSASSVSILEGGYNTRAGALSPFAQSVACHVRALDQSSPELSYASAKILQQLTPVMAESTSDVTVKRPAADCSVDGAAVGDAVRTEAPKRRKRIAAVKALAAIEEKNAQQRILLQQEKLPLVQTSAAAVLEEDM